MSKAPRPRHHHSPRPPLGDAAIGALGGTLGIALVAGLDRFVLSDGDLGLMIGAFGATAVLVFGAPGSPYAQPWNIVVGHVLSALIGVAAFLVIPAPWLAAAIAVGLAIFAMQVTRSLHPPGGASALIAVAGSGQIHELGFAYAVFPVGAGAVALVAVALVFNNLRPGRESAARWPLFWY